jgi:hypothetical protein
MRLRWWEQWWCSCLERKHCQKKGNSLNFERMWCKLPCKNYTIIQCDLSAWKHCHFLKCKRPCEIIYVLLIRVLEFILSFDWLRTHLFFSVHYNPEFWKGVMYFSNVCCWPALVLWIQLTTIIEQYFFSVHNVKHNLSIFWTNTWGSNPSWQWWINSSCS